MLRTMQSRRSHSSLRSFDRTRSPNEYDSFSDPHLVSFLSRPHVRQHLQKVGLADGETVTPLRLKPSARKHLHSSATEVGRSLVGFLLCRTLTLAIAIGERTAARGGEAASPAALQGEPERQCCAVVAGLLDLCVDRACV
jgi:hypothetical protein